MSIVVSYGSKQCAAIGGATHSVEDGGVSHGQKEDPQGSGGRSKVIASNNETTPASHRVARGGLVRRGGFSLIELLIAIAIVLAIGGLVAVNLLPKKAESDINLTRTQIDTLEGALKMFQLDMKRIPTEDEGIAALWNKELLEDEDEAANWKGPYLESPITTDTWGTEWFYTDMSENLEGTHEIISYGPDREEGTEDDISSLDRKRDADGEIGEEFSDFGDGGDLE